MHDVTSLLIYPTSNTDDSRRSSVKIRSREWNINARHNSTILIIGGKSQRK